MFASWIIDTSLAPSPMATEIFPNLILTCLTTSAFWPGVTRQQITASQFRLICKNFCERFSFPKINPKIFKISRDMIMDIEF